MSIIANLDPDTQRRINSGANWFYWIAVLSAINSILVLNESTMSFMFGLGLTQVIDAIGAESGMGRVAIMVNAVVFAVTAVVGHFARHSFWLYAGGMVFLALDSLIFALGKDWLGFGFHILILIFMFGGAKALKALKSQNAS